MLGDSFFPIKFNRRWLYENLLHLKRLAILVGVLLVSILLALMGLSPSRLRIILGSLIGLGVVLVFLKSPQLGIVILIISSIAVPFSLGTGTSTSISAPIMLLVLLIGLWILEMWRKKAFRLHSSRVILPILAFSIVSILAFLVGQQKWLYSAQTAPLTTQIGALSIFLFSTGAFLLVAHQVGEIVWLKRMTWTLLVLAGIIVFAFLIPGAASFVFPGIVPRSATGSVLWIWIFAIAFSQAMFNRRLSIWSRIGIFIILLGAIYIRLIVRQTWTSGWLPPVAAIGVILWVGAPRLVMYAGGAVGLFALFNAQRIVDFVMVGDNAYSLTTRLAAWQILFEIVKVNPILGLGPANYYFYTPLFPILGWWVPFNSHNNFVDILAQTGILGFICFIWIFWELGRLGMWLRDRVPEGFEQAYVYGVLGGIAGTLVAAMLGDWVVPFVYNVGLEGFRSAIIGWIFLGGLVVIEQIYRKKNQI
jgi:hypothetical protein